MAKFKQLALIALPLFSLTPVAHASLYADCIASGEALVDARFGGSYTKDVDDSSQDLASSTIKGYLNVQGRSNCLRVEGIAGIDGKLLNNDIQVASVTAGATATNAAQFGVDGRVNVMGTDILSQEYTMSAEEGPSLKKDLPILPIPDLGLYAGIPLGPVILDVGVGVRTKLNVALEAGYDNLALTAKAVPSADVTGFTEASARILLNKISLGGEVSIISDDLAFEAYGRWDAPQNGFAFGYGITNTANLAGGNIYGSVNDKYKLTIYEWPGYTFEKTLAQGSTFLPVQ
ncbi:hypothetical protein L6J37_05055 [Photobacterium sp. WH77]|uniref:hypothetical protein n=1 Tax=Photobacterium TaxID=657 RepID=UPI001C455BD4|nr:MULTISPECIES: hypothetical protein [Photobacterium]MBV7261328.1 hypothetical protein [Photobacterium sp. WH24]MCG2836228.1 hypothetical protein [Photobacterium sp. WH77]MCG2843635.1 hypothetical protein [Photobacterium sp. WH80]